MNTKSSPERSAMLRQQQAWLLSLLNPHATGASPWSAWRAGVRTADQAGAVYINNVRANVIQALLQTFPGTAQWLGERRFKQLMVEALTTHPPSGGDLSTHGAWLSGWLSCHADDEACRQGAWLADIEWALDQARCTPTDKAWLWPQAAADLQLPHWTGALTRLRHPWRSWTLGPDRLQVLQHSAELLQTERPLVCAPDDGQPVTLLLQGQRLHLIKAADWFWLTSLDSGCNLELACEKTVSVWPAWTPDRILTDALAQGYLTPLRFIPRPPLMTTP